MSTCNRIGFRVKIIIVGTFKVGTFTFKFCLSSSVTTSICRGWISNPPTTNFRIFEHCRPYFARTHILRLSKYSRQYSKMPKFVVGGFEIHPRQILVVTEDERRTILLQTGNRLAAENTSSRKNNWQRFWNFSFATRGTLSDSAILWRRRILSEIG